MVAPKPLWYPSQEGYCSASDFDCIERCVRAGAALRDPPSFIVSCGAVLYVEAAVEMRRPRHVRPVCGAGGNTGAGTARRGHGGRLGRRPTGPTCVPRWWHVGGSTWSVRRQGSRGNACAT